MFLCNRYVDIALDRFPERFPNVAEGIKGFFPHKMNK